MVLPCLIARWRTGSARGGASGGALGLCPGVFSEYGAKVLAPLGERGDARSGRAAGTAARADFDKLSRASLALPVGDGRARDLWGVMGDSWVVSWGRGVKNAWVDCR